MIRLREIGSGDAGYVFVERLWQAAFPEAERRDREAQRANTDSNPVFHCVLAENEDDVPVGFLTYWDFGTFCYVEHFATDPAMRNHGYGGQILQVVLERVGRPLVLEVEMPEDEMSHRRVGFYERNGLRLWQETPYIQPAYRVGGESLPMRLMTTPDLQQERNAERVICTIHRYVYGIDG